MFPSGMGQEAEREVFDHVEAQLVSLSYKHYQNQTQLRLFTVYDQLTFYLSYAVVYAVIRIYLHQ